jgi:predicted signal transduction protein with EAL and GGDEF domain
LEVTAEGIETAAEAAMVRSFGCDHAQGYYFARPLPPAQIDTLWASGLTFNRPAATAPEYAVSTGAASKDVREPKRGRRQRS